ncbi:MAG: nucleotidyltransferase domain-containing protein [Proteobacteria bacterium]|nr:nucleotidyltransferase domain-containing protein [Pseudomonadota bacterium]
MLKPSDIARLQRDTIHRIVTAHRGTNPRLFGSTLRGDDTAQSDLDLLVDLLPGSGLLDLGAMQFELEAALGVPVDVLVAGDLPARFRDEVLGSARAL